MGMQLNHHTQCQYRASLGIMTLAFILIVLKNDALAAQPVGQDFSTSTFSAANKPLPSQSPQRTLRIALVIGNSTYGTAGKLRNPSNDADDMDRAFKELGFEVVLKKDVTRRETEEAIRQFNAQLSSAQMAVFYYAGHGVQVDGENYLIPIGAKIDRETDVPYEAFPLGKILGAMDSSGNSGNVIFLDACRNNPYERQWRSDSRGLADVRSNRGTLISFATAPGKVAEDGKGRNSPYTASLLEFIQEPELPIELVLKNVRRSVMKMTEGRQISWESSSLVDPVIFNARGMSNIALADPPKPLPVQPIKPSPKPLPPKLPLVQNKRPLIVIDPGHGGSESGSIGIDNIVEKEVTLDIGLKVADLLKQNGVDVVLTRSQDSDLDLQQRLDIASQHQTAALVSIHANSISLDRPDVNGVETYYYDDKSLGLANAIHSQFLQETKIEDRRVRKARFFLIRKASMPSILIETGFLTGAQDAQKLRDPQMRRLMAQGITKGILQFLQSQSSTGKSLEK
jgi:N-acetylmuramoyl-L-alanine amidase